MPPPVNLSALTPPPPQVLCMSRAALSILPCKHYPPSSLVETLTVPSSITGCGQPVPARFTLPPAATTSTPTRPGAAPDAAHTSSSSSNGGIVSVIPKGLGAPAAKVTTTGSTVDRILSVSVTSLSVIFEKNSNNNNNHDDKKASAPASGAAATAGGGATFPPPTPSPPSTAAETNTVPELSGAQLEQAMGLVLAGVSGAVSASRLRWGDVANLRIYYCCCDRGGPPAATSTTTGNGNGPYGTGGGRRPAHDPMLLDGAGGGIDEESVKRAAFLALARVTRERPAVTFVPVSGLEAGGVVSVHATAWDLDRLRTELWVRGSA